MPWEMVDDNNLIVSLMVFMRFLLCVLFFFLMFCDVRLVWVLDVALSVLAKYGRSTDIERQNQNSRQ